MKFDPRQTRIPLDANVFQAPGAQARAVARLLELNREGELDLLLPPRVEAELLDPRTPAQVRRRAGAVRGAPARPTTETEHRLLARVIEVLQGQAAPGRHEADAANLVEAYPHANVFVTCDRRLLERRGALGAVMPSLTIVSPAELLDAYEAWAARDEDWRVDG